MKKLNKKYIPGLVVLALVLALFVASSIEPSSSREGDLSITSYVIGILLIVIGVGLILMGVTVLPGVGLVVLGVAMLFGTAYISRLAAQYGTMFYVGVVAVGIIAVLLSRRRY